jgi:hypothetical protein
VSAEIKAFMGGHGFQAPDDYVHGLIDSFADNEDDDYLSADGFSHLCDHLGV